MLSQLQQQYPLSPKKIWKKIILKIIPFYIVSLIMVGALTVFSFLADNSPFTIWDGTAVIFLAVFLLVIFLFFYGLYVRVYINRYYYDGGDNFITIKKGVFAPAEIHVQYQKIQDVYVDQDILDRMMGLYDVHIASATASSSIEAHIDGVDQASAEALKELFLNRIQGRTADMGTGTSKKGSGSNVASQQASGPIVASFAEEISSKSYPIQGKWLFVRLIGSVLSSLLWSLIITGWFALPGQNSAQSLLSAMGYGGYGFLIWFVLFAIFFALYYIYFILWRKNFTFQFMPEYIFVRTGIIGKQEKHVPYNTLQDVGISQGVFERMFGLASVKIENAASSQMRVGRNGRPIFNGIMIPGQSPESAQKITEALKNVILKKSAPSSTGL